mmetsp:Transcript_39846/g.119880  ORF Transcript_39846/g.119880 Transcript_39846/m.119880 type:complete len:85 (-) Transcript_39846:1166-1420(-)
MLRSPYNLCNNPRRAKESLPDNANTRQRRNVAGSLSEAKDEVTERIRMLTSICRLQPQPKEESQTPPKQQNTWDHLRQTLRPPL